MSKLTDILGPTEQEPLSKLTGMRCSLSSTKPPGIASIRNTPSRRRHRVSKITGKLHCASERRRKWRTRFVARRMAGLVDEPLPGRIQPELVLSRRACRADALGEDPERHSVNALLQSSRSTKPCRERPGQRSVLRRCRPFSCHCGVGVDARARSRVWHHQGWYSCAAHASARGYCRTPPRQ